MPSSLVKNKLTNEQFDALDKKAKEMAMASVKFAEKSPEPPIEDLYAYTYVDDGVDPHLTDISPKATLDQAGQTRSR